MVLIFIDLLEDSQYIFFFSCFSLVYLNKSRNKFWMPFNENYFSVIGFGKCTKSLNFCNIHVHYHSNEKFSLTTCNFNYRFVHTPSCRFFYRNFFFVYSLYRLPISCAQGWYTFGRFDSGSHGLRCVINHTRQILHQVKKIG